MCSLYYKEHNHTTHKYIFIVAPEETLWLIHWGRDKMAGIFQTNVFNCIILNENVSVLIQTSLKCVR